MSAGKERTLLSPRFGKEAGSAVYLGGEQRRLTATIAGKLCNGSYRLPSDPCPCGQPGPDLLLSEVDRYGLPLNTVLCSACGTLRIDPYPDDASLADFYTHFYQQMYDRSVDRHAYFIKQQGYGRRILKSIKGWLPPGSSIFEIGCGAGGALDLLRQAGYQVGGCDYSRELVDHGRARGLPLLWGPPIEALKSQTAPDMVYLHHVFEHVRDPLGLLVELRQLLAPKGKILIVVPDVSRIGRFPFPAGDLRLFLHIAHRFNFSLEGFRALAGRAALDLELLQQRDAHNSPEFWALLGCAPATVFAQHNTEAGRHMLDYLRHTENMQRLGLTRGQILGLPGRIRRKLGRMLGRNNRTSASGQTEQS